jgi:glutathione S-transferase
MSTITVYSIPGSPYGRMPLMACEEKGVPWRLHALSLDEVKRPEHLARHPFGRIPAIEHEGWDLYETQAILRYIDQVFEGPSLTPAEPRAMARMSQVMNIVDCYAAPSLSNAIGWNLIIAPMFGLPSDLEAVTAAMPLGRTSVDVLETLLGDRPFFVGGQLSLADIMVFPHLEFVPMTPQGRELLANAPRLSAWIERISERPSATKTTMQVLAEPSQSEAA